MEANSLLIKRLFFEFIEIKSSQPASQSASEARKSEMFIFNRIISLIYFSSSSAATQQACTNERVADLHAAEREREKEKQLKARQGKMRGDLTSL